MWCHLPTIFKRRHVLRAAALIALCVGITTTLFFNAPSHAAPGVNQVIGFQGRLLSASGGVVPDGTYNIQFKIYQDGTGQAAGDPDGSLKWTETYTSGTGGGIAVKNGYFSVDLGSRTPFGSSIDWNQDTLWLSMNIAGSAACTTFGSDCTADGEMLPMKRIDSVPYAMNAGTVGGKSASDLIQNGTTQQTADFNISGAGTADKLQGNTSVEAPLFDTTAAGGALSVGSTNAAAISVGSSASDQTISIGTGTGIKTLQIGSKSGGSGTTIQGGTEGIGIYSQGGITLGSGGTNQLTFDGDGTMNFLDSSGGNTLTIESTGTITTGSSSAMDVKGVATFEQGATFDGGLTIQGPAAAKYISPVTGASLSTAINIPNYTVPAYGSVVAFGIPAGSATTARGLVIADARHGTHQATIGILSPDEQSVMGLSWESNTDGTNPVATMTTMSDTLALQGNGLNLLTATNENGQASVGIGTDASASYALNVNGDINSSNLYTNKVDTASAGPLNIGTTNATSITLGADTTLAAGKSLTITGGATSTRPSSPTEGMIYYDTDTNQLLTYANGKWQGDRTTAKIVAASDSSQTSKDSADYVADGTADDVEINAALTAAAGGTVYLLPGTYNIAATVNVPANTTLMSDGRGTATSLVRKFTNTSENGVVQIAADSSTVSGLAIDGNGTTDTDTTDDDIYMTSTASRATISGNDLHDAAGDGLYMKGDATKANQKSVVENNNFEANGQNGLQASQLYQAQITKNTASGNGADGFLTSDGENYTLTNNQSSDNKGSGFEVSSTKVTLSSNSATGNTYAGILASYSSDVTVTSNTLADNAYAGIALVSTSDSSFSNNSITATTTTGPGVKIGGVSSDNNNFTGNSISGVSEEGIKVTGGSGTGNSFSANTIRNYGGTNGYPGIGIDSGFSATKIVNNTINDTDATGYAIDNASDGTYFSNNSFSGSGANGIHDTGTGTTYSNQLDANGKLVNESTSGLSVKTDTDSANALVVQNTSDASVLAVNTDDSSVLVAGRLDTTGAGTLTLGNANATSIAIGNPTTSITNSIYGSTVLKSATDGNSPVVFQLQQANGTPMLTADSNAQTITIGNATSGDKMVISTANGQVTYYGSARRTKKISLTAEYTGSVLDTGATGNNTGTMTSSVDLTNRMNYYKWTTNQSTNQSYDVVVQIPLPTDFDGWANSNPLSISTYTSDTTNGTITLEARDSSNAVQCAFATSSLTPTTTNTWTTNNTACTLNSGTYTAGNYITLRLRMQSPNSGDVRLGNINLSYLSKF